MVGLGDQTSQIVPYFSLLSRCPSDRDSVPHLTGSNSDKSKNYSTGAFLKCKEIRAAVIIRELHQLPFKIRSSVPHHDQPARHDAGKIKQNKKRIFLYSLHQ
ncbi:hypothetical protein ATANTOWER_030308 [Ataeniobius toweri]|uniref:Uncharacterized protein n=1 Tax=Ataeniobius toweri TaxID=208326 RepID=A0ABU7A0E5_9TELE|nr:hypothetical protein [Ataeniobius toweri]